MLTTRQRISLFFLCKRSEPIGRTTLMKWLFLYSQAQVTPVSHYDFVPYKYGPFSFEAFRDLQYSLARFVEIDPEHVALRSDCQEEVREQTQRIPKRELQAAEYIWTRYHALKQEALLDYVYQSYPWFASRSERVKSSITLTTSEPAVYSIGYEGRSVDAFFATLLSSGIKGILDVRRNAYSQKYGFLAHTLKSIGPQLQLTYHHIPELGIASELRKELNRPETLDRLFDNYEQDLKNKQEHLECAGKIVSSAPTALLCFEAEHHQCHRGRLAVHLASLTGLPIRHL